MNLACSCCCFPCQCHHHSCAIARRLQEIATAIATLERERAALIRAQQWSVPPPVFPWCQPPLNVKDVIKNVR